MENIFDVYSDFITTDQRTQRPFNKFGSYTVTSYFQFIRHQIILPPD